MTAEQRNPSVTTQEFRRDLFLADAVALYRLNHGLDFLGTQVKLASLNLPILDGEGRYE